MKTFIESTAADHHGWCDAIECDVCHKRVEREGVTPQQAIDGFIPPSRPIAEVRKFPDGALIGWTTVEKRLHDSGLAHPCAVDLCPTCSEVLLDRLEEFGVNARVPREPKTVYVTPSPRQPPLMATLSGVAPTDWAEADRVMAIQNALGVIPASVPIPRLPPLEDGVVRRTLSADLEPYTGGLTEEEIQQEMGDARAERREAEDERREP